MRRMIRVVVLALAIGRVIIARAAVAQAGVLAPSVTAIRPWPTPSSALRSIQTMSAAPQCAAAPVDRPLRVRPVRST